MQTYSFNQKPVPDPDNIFNVVKIADLSLISIVRCNFFEMSYKNYTKYN